MVATYRTREEKELAVIRALMAGPNSSVKTLLICKKEQVFYDIDDVEAGFIFFAIENPDYVVKFFKKENTKNDESNGRIRKETPAGKNSGSI